MAVPIVLAFTAAPLLVIWGVLVSLFRRDAPCEACRICEGEHQHHDD